MQIRIYFFVLFLISTQLAHAVTPFNLNSNGNATSSTGIDESYPPKMSLDGRFIAYTSDATNIIAGASDSNGVSDVFVFDTLANTNKLVSHTTGSSLTAANGLSRVLGITANGNKILFESVASNLVSGFVDNNAGSYDVFVWNRSDESIELVSAAAGSSTQGLNAVSAYAVISPDGSAAAFGSNATNAISGHVDLNGASTDLYYRNLVTKQTQLVSHEPGSSVRGADFLSFLQIDQPFSGDGKKLAFISTSHNIVSMTVNSAYNIFYYDAETGQNNLVSHAANSLTATGNNFANGYRMTLDGSAIVFDSAATDHVTGFINNNAANEEIYSYRLSDGAISLISHSSASAVDGPNDFCRIKYVNFDGSVIAYVSEATNLVSGITDINNDYDVFVWKDNQNLVYSVDSSGLQTGDAGSNYPVLSQDGRYLLFESNASNLTTGDTNGNDFDIFFVDLDNSSRPTALSVGTSNNTGNDSSFGAFIGRNSLGFLSRATNLTSVTDANGSSTDGFFYNFSHLGLVSPDATQLVDSDTTSISGVAEEGSLIRVYQDRNNDNEVDEDDEIVFERNLSSEQTEFTFTDVPLESSKTNNLLVVSVCEADLESFASDVPTITDVPTYSARIKSKKNGTKFLVVKDETNTVVKRTKPFGKYTGKVRLARKDLNSDGFLDIRVKAKINGKTKTKKYSGVDLSKL